jgi:nucleoside-diphosphate-sugar epimerase
MLHVVNAVQALMLAGTKPAVGSTYIVSDERAYSTREIYEGVRAALGRSPSALAVPEWAFRLLAAGGDLARHLAGRRLGFDSEALQKLLGSARYDCRLIRHELGYRPGHDLLHSLPLLVEDTRTAS